MDNYKKTALYDLHLASNGRMVNFANYQLPMQYKTTIAKEHLHTREAAGLFDVSHMGQIRLHGDSVEAIATALEKLIPADLLSLKQNRQKYCFLTNDNGGIIDDCIVSQIEDYFILVVNASRKEVDINHLRQNLPQNITLELLEDRALLALQGPMAETILKRYIAECELMRFMDVKKITLWHQNCTICRAGYTGEDGFEISLPNEIAGDFAKQLLESPEIMLIGLGARDSLRLEAGLCLYGNDIDETTNPVTAGLKWAISPARRVDGIRAGGFLGESTILESLKHTPEYRFSGFIAEGKIPLRADTKIVDSDGNDIGHLTSGCLSPCLNKPIAMGYIKNEAVANTTEMFALLRGGQKRIPISLTALPFVKKEYCR